MELQSNAHQLCVSTFLLCKHLVEHLEQQHWKKWSDELLPCRLQVRASMQQGNGKNYGNPL